MNYETHRKQVIEYYSNQEPKKIFENDELSLSEICSASGFSLSASTTFSSTVNIDFADAQAKSETIFTAESGVRSVVMSVTICT